MRYW